MFVCEVWEADKEGSKLVVRISIYQKKTDSPTLYVVKWFQSAMFTLLMWSPYAYGEHKVFLENKKQRKQLERHSFNLHVSPHFCL